MEELEVGPLGPLLIVNFFDRCRRKGKIFHRIMGFTLGGRSQKGVHKGDTYGRVRKELRKGQSVQISWIHAPKHGSKLIAGSKF